MSNILDNSVLDSKDYNDPNSVLYRGGLSDNQDTKNVDEIIISKKKFKESLIKVEKRIRLIEFPKIEKGENIQLIQTSNPYWIQKNAYSFIASIDTSSSNAVRQFTQNPMDFKMDCNGYSSAILIAAIEDTLGAELFNKFIDKNKFLTSNEFLFATNKVTGLIPKDGWIEIEKEDYFLNKDGDKLLHINKLLQIVEIGTWISVESPFLRDTVYSKENIIKVGNDNYFAQGLGVGALSFRQILNGLVDKAIDFELIDETQRNDSLEMIFIGSVTEWDLITK